MINKYRKKPTQSRSKITVDALLEATTHILLSDGLDGLNTNRIAEVAGVSIGSLYQYFPNKASLIAALIEQHVSCELERLTKLLIQWSLPPGEQLFRALIKEFIQIHLDDLELTKLLHKQVSFLECRNVLRQATRRFEELIVKLLKEQFNGQLSMNVIRSKSFIITNSIDALVQLALEESVDLLFDSHFIDELVDMVSHVFDTIPAIETK